MKNSCGIYKITSIRKPERVYIGSAVCISNRWKDHLKRFRKGNHDNSRLQNHCNKYGIYDFQFSILAGCAKEDLLALEQFYIDAFAPWFNICKVAGSRLGVKVSDITKQKQRLAKLGTISSAKGKKWSEESRAKMRGNKNGAGHKMTEDNKQKLEISLRHHRANINGDKNPFFGKKHSEETKLRLSQKNKGRKHTAEVRAKMLGHVPWNKGLKLKGIA